MVEKNSLHVIGLDKTNTANQIFGCLLEPFSYEIEEQSSENNKTKMVDILDIKCWEKLGREQCSLCNGQVYKFSRSPIQRKVIFKGAKSEKLGCSKRN